MNKPKMTVAELEAFLHREFPQAFASGEILIESADGATCLLGLGTHIDGDGGPGDVCRAAFRHRADRTRDDHQSQHQFPAQGAAGTGCARCRQIDEVGQASRRRRSEPVIRDFARSNRPCDLHILHSECLEFLQVLLHHIFKLLFLNEYFWSFDVDVRGAVL